MMSLIKRMLVWAMPRQFFHLQMRSKTHEPEVALVAELLPAGGVAVDVGANEGLWVYHFQKLAGEVVAFEPSERLARDLERKSADHVRVERVALSHKPGIAVLRFPRWQRAWGTIEAANQLQRTDRELISQDVPVRTLDSYELARVDLIKIDIEGHEFAALQGATKTIERCRPSLIIEIEEEHNRGALSRVRSFLEDLGYCGFFFDDGLQPIEDFDPEVDQNPLNVSASGKVGRYINNFIFKP